MAAIRTLAKRLVGDNFGNRVRLAKLKLRKRLYRQPIVLADLKDELLRLGTWRGRTVWVQTSWNECYNLECKPSDVVAMMRDLVGPQGNLVMPAFPLQNDPDSVLDIDSVPVSTGMVCEIFRRQADVRRSIHLRSAVAAAGPDADEICRGHHLTPYPWGDSTPYAFLYGQDALMVGLGVVPMGFTPLHRVECLWHQKGLAPSGVFDGMITYQWRRRSGESGTHTFHNRVGGIDPGRLVKHFSPALYKTGQISNLAVMALPARAGIDRAITLAEVGISIYKQWPKGKI